MSFWPPPSARWSLAPGVRRENEGVGKRGPRNRDGAAATERTSAQRAFRRHDAQALLKDSTLCAAEAVVVRCPFGRSEEHTSELQSRGQLVCRLLLEKTDTCDLACDSSA